jgi:hypothetical protein
MPGGIGHGLSTLPNFLIGEAALAIPALEFLAFSYLAGKKKCFGILALAT